MAIAGFMFAFAFGLVCLVWYALAGLSLSNPKGVYSFLGLGLRHVVAAVTLIIAARTRWRWCILLLTLPCAFEIFERSFELWRWTH